MRLAKKWLLVIGLCVSSGLFFTSGILMGYVMYGTGEAAEKGGERAVRRPRILTDVVDPVIGRVVDMQANRAKMQIVKMRAPTDSAVLRAQQYGARIR